jgi:hypothetical protein
MMHDPWFLTLVQHNEPEDEPELLEQGQPANGEIKWRALET